MVAAPPADADRYRLANAGVAVCLLDDASGLTSDHDGIALADFDIADGRIAAIRPTGATEPEGAVVDLRRGLVWPCFVDMHTHLDKGHIWERAPNPDGSFEQALATVRGDRAANWSAEDLRPRIEFGLRCSYAHGTAAIRTHLDTDEIQAGITWPLFREIKQEWAGRIELQAATICVMDDFVGPPGERLADLVADCGGLLGGVTYMMPGLEAGLDRVFRLAADRGVDLDFHVDESLDPEARSLRLIAEAALRIGFQGRVVAGHCCSLAMQPEDDVDRTLDLLAEAGIAIVSLPMCNLYLQDRTPGRTPRSRGITLVHELKARGIPVAVASDNCRDPFYGFGDHDMLEVFTQAVRIAHLDRPYGDWPRAVTATPAAVMGLDGTGRIAVGASADLICFSGRRYSELLSRREPDRIVLRAGRAVDTALPSYEELDHLVYGAET